jgi:uncharacterized protein (TIGR02246 family)
MNRLLLVVSIVAIGFAEPAASQQNARPAIEELGTEYIQAYNTKDVSAIVGLYTEDAVLVTPSGIVKGKEELEDYFRCIFPMVSTDYISTTEQLGATGDAPLWSAGSYNVTLTDVKGPIKSSGFWSVVYAMDGGRLRIRMSTFTVTLPPATADLVK